MTSPLNAPLLPPASHAPKRQRGAQPGNHNARTHGFYAARLTPVELCQFWDIVNTEGLDPEIAAIRVKLRSSLEHDPANHRVLREGSKLLARWYSSRYRLHKTNSSILKQLIWDILRSYSALSLCLPEQTPTHAVVLTKRIECGYA